MFDSDQETSYFGGSHGRLIAEATDGQPVVHLLYHKAVDPRICLILSRLDLKVKPASATGKLRKTRGHHELVVIDVDSALEAGASIVEGLAAGPGRSPMVAVCMDGSIDFFRRCFRAGVIDVLDKSFDDQRLADAFGAIRAFKYRQPSPFASLRQRQLRYESLTLREREVFHYLLNGRTNREIGELLALSTRTIEIHRAHLKEKLHVRNTAQMAGEYSGLIGHYSRFNG